MAVEAPHMTLISPQTLINRGMIEEGKGTRNDDRIQTAYGMVPLPGTKPEIVPPMYGTGMAESFPANTLKAESGLTCSLPISRKRSRESASLIPPFSDPTAPIVNQNQIGKFAFLSEDISWQIYQQQMEIDRFIAQHTEKVRKDIQEMRRRNSRRVMAAAEEGILKKLKAKEDEIMKIGQLNWSLEEKVKSLSIENQIWGELAQTNEATANALRINLQQVLSQSQIHQHHQIGFSGDGNGTKTASIVDAQSYCGSNYEEDEDECRSRLAGGKRWCRNCGKEEACVLLLPCRHLSVCSVCASAVGDCPVCKCNKSAAVHVNITSS